MSPEDTTVVEAPRSRATNHSSQVFGNSFTNIIRVNFHPIILTTVFVATILVILAVVLSLGLSIQSQCNSNQPHHSTVSMTSVVRFLRQPFGLKAKENFGLAIPKLLADIGSCTCQLRPFSSLFTRCCDTSNARSLSHQQHLRTEYLYDVARFLTTLVLRPSLMSSHTPQPFLPIFCNNPRVHGLIHISWR